MADEISISASFSVLTDLLASASLSGSGTVSITTLHPDVVQATQNISNSADSALDFGAISGVPGMLCVKNLDATNPVTLSLATGGGFAASAFMIIPKLGIALFQPYSATIYAKATTAAVQIEFAACEL